MENRNGEVHVETDEARGGVTPNIVRWVLGIGLLLAVIAMSAAWMIPALQRAGQPQKVSVSRDAEAVGRNDIASDSSSTDSIVGEDADRIDGAAAAPDEGGGATTENAPTAQ